MIRESIKPNPKKVKGIKYIGKPTITTEARDLIGMVHYYRDMWTSRSHILDPLTEAASVHKGGKILLNDALGSTFK